MGEGTVGRQWWTPQDLVAQCVVGKRKGLS